MGRTKLIQVLVTEEDYWKLRELLEQTDGLSRRTVSTLLYEQAVRPLLEQHTDEKKTEE